MHRKVPPTQLVQLVLEQWSTDPDFFMKQSTDALGSIRFASLGLRCLIKDNKQRALLQEIGQLSQEAIAERERKYLKGEKLITVDPPWIKKIQKQKKEKQQPKPSPVSSYLSRIYCSIVRVIKGKSKAQLDSNEKSSNNDEEERSLMLPGFVDKQKNNAKIKYS